MKTLRRLVPVSVVTAFAALCVWGLVTVAQTTAIVAPGSVAGRVASAAVAGTPVADSGAPMQRCPRTGCAATSCHGAVGAPPPRVSGQPGVAGGAQPTAMLREVEFEFDDD